MTGQADELLAAGDVSGARAALVDAIKRTPDDQRARMFLFQLLAVQGEWDKALAQLRALAQLSPEAQMLAATYNQAIAAEQMRAKAFAGEVPFTVLIASSSWVDDLAQALTAFSAGRISEGEERRAQAFDAAADTPGELDGQRFAWLADADGRFGPAFEAVVAGRWGLVPFEAVSDIKTEGPKDLRDVVWLPAEMRLKSGQSFAAFLPARYPGTELESDPAVRLGRKTEWKVVAGGEGGLGQRVWQTDAGAETGLLSLRQLTFD
jgi:type VI secretion system protein ImpE